MDGKTRNYIISLEINTPARAAEHQTLSCVLPGRCPSVKCSFCCFLLCIMFALFLSPFRAAYKQNLDDANHHNVEKEHIAFIFKVPNSYESVWKYNPLFVLLFAGRPVSTFYLFYIKPVQHNTLCHNAPNNIAITRIIRRLMVLYKFNCQQILRLCSIHKIKQQ